jgi:hypothetical protein
MYRCSFPYRKKFNKCRIDFSVFNGIMIPWNLGKAVRLSAPRRAGPCFCGLPDADKKTSRAGRGETADIMQSDYIMRQIEMITQMLGKILFQSEPSKSEIITDNFFARDEMLKSALKRLIDANQINDAENLLYSEIENNKSPELLKLGIWFYERLSMLDEQTLTDCDYSRQEIVDGLKLLQKKYKGSEPV